jgi:uncharacterized cupin superfamily protein
MRELRSRTRTGACMTDKAAELREKLIRNPRDAALVRERRDPLYETRCVRLSTGTAAHKLGGGFDVVPPGKRSCPYHFHHNQEELFIVLRGRGALRVDGEMLAIEAGDVIFIPPGREFAHQIVNDSDAPLEYLSFSTQEIVDVIEYPDSRKLLARAPGVRHSARADGAVDYWEGEP